MQPNNEPLTPSRLQEIQGKIKLTTKYQWNDRGTEEFLPHSSDGSFIITKDVPSSAYYVSLKVC